MDYLYAEKDDFSFLASGNVIKHFSGMPCFPVRLNLELFERVRHAVGKERISVYDPCCGSGFSLTVLGLMRRERIEWLRGSDVNPACLEAAACNTSLLTREGLFAVCLCHEIDHLDGIIYVDKMIEDVTDREEEFEDDEEYEEE